MMGFFLIRGVGVAELHKRKASPETIQEYVKGVSEAEDPELFTQNFLNNYEN